MWQKAHAEDGICEANPAQTRLKELMARHGREVYAGGLVQLGLRPFHAWARLALRWTLATNDGADREQVRKFMDAGMEVEVATVGRSKGNGVKKAASIRAEVAIPMMKWPRWLVHPLRVVG